MFRYPLDTTWCNSFIGSVPQSDCLTNKSENKFTAKLIGCRFLGLDTNEGTGVLPSSWWLWMKVSLIDRAKKPMKDKFCVWIDWRLLRFGSTDAVFGTFCSMRQVSWGFSKRKIHPNGLKTVWRPLPGKSTKDWKVILSEQNTSLLKDASKSCPEQLLGCAHCCNGDCVFSSFLIN